MPKDRGVEFVVAVFIAGAVGAWDAAGWLHAGRLVACRVSNQTVEFVSIKNLHGFWLIIYFGFLHQSC